MIEEVRLAFALGVFDRLVDKRRIGYGNPGKRPAVGDHRIHCVVREVEGQQAGGPQALSVSCQTDVIGTQCGSAHRSQLCRSQAAACSSRDDDLMNASRSALT